MNERWLAEAVHCTRLPLQVAASAVMLRSIGIWAAGRAFFSAALAALAMAPMLRAARADRGFRLSGCLKSPSMSSIFAFYYEHIIQRKLKGTQCFRNFSIINDLFTIIFTA